MKKIILVIILILSIAGTAWAQEKPQSKANERKAQREARQIAEKEAQERYAQRLITSLKDGNLYFNGQTMQIRNLDRYDLRAPYNVVSVGAGEILVKLPYYTSANTMSGVPRTVDFRSDDFRMSYKVQKGICLVTIEVRSVKNTYNSAFTTPSGSYRLVFTIPISDTGMTRLNLSPSFTSTITYEGVTAIYNQK